MKKYILILLTGVAFQNLVGMQRKSWDEMAFDVLDSDSTANPLFINSQQAKSLPGASLEIRKKQKELLKSMSQTEDKQYKEMLEKQTVEIKKLLERGASANAVSKDGFSLLDEAVAYKNLPLAKVLLEKGAKINQENKYHDTPLVRALMVDDIPMVKFLIDNGADINVLRTKSQGGKESLLHRAVRHGYIYQIKPLLAFGIDPTIKDSNGKTALELAKSVAQAGSLPANPLPTISLEDLKQIPQTIEEYIKVLEQATTKPTKDTLREAVKQGYLVLVKKLLQKMNFTSQELSQYGSLAEQQFKRSGIGIYQDIAELLRKYQEALDTLARASSKTGDQMPPEVARLIAKKVIGYTASSKN
ncbi:ankyrin repeat domain-containing protein [Candidatus Dependentiae bacterium]|nr:ankyrin repeat domain-containing protein [Candidatus Dependentiae bacterium]